MDVYGFGIDFCQIWYVFNLLKQVLGPFFMVLGLFFHFYFWTRNGSKMGFRPLVFKGLRVNPKKRGRVYPNNRG